MDVTAGPSWWIAAAGLVAGLWLLGRGFVGSRTAARLGDISTSRIASIAAGEVRVSGIVEPAELTLVSPLQSRPCVYYRSEIRGDDSATGEDVIEERAVGFHVRDETGAIRVFPRAARWDAPTRLDARTDVFGELPAELDLRTGSAFGPGALDDAGDPDGLARALAVEALLTVRQPAGRTGSTLRRLASTVGSRRTERARYRERRLEPGDAVTVVGRAIPFGDLADPAAADVAVGGVVSADDPEVAADVAEARAAGLLAATPEAAWGNAAIPGFGIGRPVRAPALDLEATVPELASHEDAARSRRRFHIDAPTLVVVGGAGVPLLIAHGSPGAATARHHDRFVLGLLGAVLAIGSAMVLAISLGGGAGR